jgi:hypothetical protein
MPPRVKRTAITTVDLGELLDVIERRAAYGERAARLGGAFEGFMADAIDARDALQAGAPTVTVQALDVALALGDGAEADRINRDHEPDDPIVVDTTSGTYRPAS